MTPSRQRAKLRRWKARLQAPARAAAAEADLAAQFIARFEGRLHKAYVLAPSLNQLWKWQDQQPAATQVIHVQRPQNLEGVRFNAVVALVELDGWMENASPELLAAVRRVKLAQGL